MLHSRSEHYWYIFYTYPRAEKTVFQELVRRNYEAFLPMTSTLRVWKNRQKKLIDHPLFPNYIFVETPAIELYRIVQIPKIVSYVTFSGKPSVISSKEIEGIKKMLNSGKEITIEKNFIEGDKVKIVSGQLAGYEGILARQNGKTLFGIRFEQINHTVLIDINTNQVRKIIC